MRKTVVAAIGLCAALVACEGEDRADERPKSIVMDDFE